MNKHAYLDGYQKVGFAFGLDRALGRAKEGLLDVIGKALHPVRSGTQGTIDYHIRKSGETGRQELDKSFDVAEGRIKNLTKTTEDSVKQLQKDLDIPGEIQRGVDVVDLSNVDLSKADLSKLPVEDVVNRATNAADIPGQIRSGIDQAKIDEQIQKGLTGAGDVTWKRMRPYVYAAGGTALALPVLMLIMNRIDKAGLKKRLETLTELQRKETEMAKARLEMDQGKQRPEDEPSADDETTKKKKRKAQKSESRK